MILTLTTQEYGEEVFEFDDDLFTFQIKNNDGQGPDFYTGILNLELDLNNRTLENKFKLYNIFLNYYKKEILELDLKNEYETLFNSKFLNLKVSNLVFSDTMSEIYESFATLVVCRLTFCLSKRD